MTPPGDGRPTEAEEQPEEEEAVEEEAAQEREKRPRRPSRWPYFLWEWGAGWSHQD